MKKKFAAILITVALLALSACKGSTEHGECVGLMTQDQKQDTLVYDVSMRNAIWTVVGVETLIFPIAYLGWYIWCPERVKTVTP